MDVSVVLLASHKHPTAKNLQQSTGSQMEHPPNAKYLHLQITKWLCTFWEPSKGPLSTECSVITLVKMTSHVFTKDTYRDSKKRN